MNKFQIYFRAIQKVIGNFTTFFIRNFYDFAGELSAKACTTIYKNNNRNKTHAYYFSLGRKYLTENKWMIQTVNAE